jgi:hypothetical protein
MADYRGRQVNAEDAIRASHAKYERVLHVEVGYLLALIDDLRARQRWIPVDLELPPSDVLVLVTAKGDVHACTYCPSYDEDEPGMWTAGEWPIYDVEAWQHVPAPYKKGAT